MEVYNSTEPPKYNLSKITMPITLFCGNNDWLSSPIVRILKISRIIFSIFYYNFLFLFRM